MKYLITALFSAVIVLSYSQDKLISIKNDTLEVKVYEITQKEIKYKLSSNPDGPLVTVNKNDYMTILYNNGSSQVIMDSAKLKRLKVYKNSIKVDFFSYINGEAEVTYERLLNNYMIGIQIPLRVGFDFNLVPSILFNEYDQSNYASYNGVYGNNRITNSIRTGMFTKFYYNKPSIVRGYSGVEITGGWLKINTEFESSFYDPNTGNYNYSYNSVKYNAGIFGVMIITGFNITPHPRVTFSIDGGGGYGGIFTKSKPGYTDTGHLFYDKYSKGNGLWKVSTSIGINF